MAVPIRGYDLSELMRKRQRAREKKEYEERQKEFKKSREKALVARKKREEEQEKRQKARLKELTREGEAIKGAEMKKWKEKFAEREEEPKKGGSPFPSMPSLPSPSSPPTLPGGVPIPTSLILGIILIVVIAAIAFFAVTWLMPRLGASELSLFGMAAPGGSGPTGIIQAITTIIGIETQPVAGEKAITPKYTGATTPYYAFRIKEVKSIPTVGLMHVPDLDITGTTFRVTAVVENTGDKKADDLIMFVTPGIRDSFCEPGTGGIERPRIYDIYGTRDMERCDTQYVDNEGQTVSIGLFEDVCSWTFDLDKSQRVQRTCKLRFACQLGKYGCWCDFKEDGSVDWENCGAFNQGYTPKLNVFLIGPYVSTTRLDIQFVDADYFRLLEIHEAITSIQLPIRSKNTWGAISLWLDAGYETKQPIISGPNEVFLLRLQFENPQGGIFLTSPDDKIESTMIEKILEYVTIKDVLQKAYGSGLTNKIKSDLYFLIPTVMIPDDKKTGNIYCGDEIRYKFCEKSGKVYSNEEFENVRKDYCKAIQIMETHKGKTQPKYTVCKFIEPEEETGTSGRGVDLKNCYGKCEYFLIVPELDPGINRETFIIRADLLYYYADVKPFTGITTISEIGTGVG